MDTGSTLRRPTREDVAKRASVSGCTVSYVVSGRTDKPVHARTRARVLAAAAELGYKPNHAARALVTGSTGLISLWTGSLSVSSYYAHMMKHLHEQIKPHDYQMLVCEMQTTPNGKAPLTWSVDGIFALDYPEYVQTYRAADPHGRTPLVSIGAYHLEDIDYVGVDLALGARLAIKHLLERGCRRIAYAYEGRIGEGGDPRFTTYNEMMADAGRVPEHIIPPAKVVSVRAAGREAIKQHVALHGCPDGIFCYNDEFALGVYRGLCDLGIRVPADVALIGFDGIEDIEYLECPITTIVQPIDEMCSRAWEILQKRIDDPDGPCERLILTPTLAVRASTMAA